MRQNSLQLVEIQIVHDIPGHEDLGALMPHGEHAGRPRGQEENVRRRTQAGRGAKGFNEAHEVVVRSGGRHAPEQQTAHLNVADHAPGEHDDAHRNQQQENPPAGRIGKRIGDDQSRAAVGEQKELREVAGGRIPKGRSNRAEQPHARKEAVRKEERRHQRKRERQHQEQGRKPPSGAVDDPP
jgi:hypothetical protein